MSAQALAVGRKKKPSLTGSLVIVIIIGFLAYKTYVFTHPSPVERRVRQWQEAEAALSSKLPKVFESLVETDMTTVANVTSGSQNVHPRRLTSRASKMDLNALVAEIGNEPSSQSTPISLNTYTWATRWNTMETVIDSEGIWRLEIRSADHKDKETVFRTSDGWWKSYTVYR